MKFTSKMWAALLVAVLFLLAGMVFSLRTYQQIAITSSAQRHTQLVLSSATDFLSALKDAETGQRGYVITGNEEFLQPYLAVRDGIQGHLAQLQHLAQADARQDSLQDLTVLVNAKMAELARVIELRRTRNNAEVQQLVAGGKGKQLMDGIRSRLQTFTQLEAAALAHQEADYQATLRNLLSLVVGASVLALAAALSFAYLLYRQGLQRQSALLYQETRQLLQQQGLLNQQLQEANQTLQRSEEQLAVTLNSIGDGVITTNALAQVTSLNPLAAQLTGWTLEQARGRRIEEVLQIVHKSSRELVPNPVMDALQYGAVQELANHTVLLARDGCEYDIADSCAPILAHDGQVIGAVLVFRNVTQEYAVQQKSHDSAVLIQTILNTVADGVLTLHGQSLLIETVNPAIEAMFGYEAAYMVGRDIRLLIPAYSPQADGATEAGAEGSVRQPVAIPVREVQGHRKDGSLFTLEIALNEMWLGGERHYTGVLRDFTTRKLAEEALLQAGALQKAIFDSANFSSIATDAKGVIQIFNVGAERMLGYTALEVMNKITPADISDPQEVIVRAKSLSAELDTAITPGFEALVFKASRGIEDIYELTYIRKDGSRFPAVVSVTALRDDEAAIIGYLLIGTDNTARKLAEEALLKAGALQKAIFDSANFSSIATDAKGVIQIFNVGAERMLGYTALEVMNKITPADISDPQEVIVRAKALSAELETPIAPGFEALVFKASRGIEDIYELTYIRKDGSRFPAVVSVTALRDDEDAIIGYLLIGTDNTARKQIEEERKKLDQRLRDQQFYTRSLIEANIDAIMTTDPVGIITDVNKQMESLTDCTRDELIGAPFKKYFTDPDRAEAGIALVLSEKKITNYELTARTRGGLETVVSYNATTFYDRDRNLQGVFAAARDVTERKRLDGVLEDKNVELEAARALAEKANLAKSDFLSSMSHELRSPLNAILGFAQLMETETPAPSSGQQESIGQILRAGWHLLKLINEILDLTKIESGQIPLSKEPVLLSAILTECQGMFEPQAQQRGIEMKFPMTDTGPYVLADHTRLKQVFINLLTNAIKYNRPHGTVEVLCKLQSQARVRVSIRDTGLGLRLDQQAQLFQAFNRLGQEAGGVEGTGIGLVVAKQLVELMGGTIGAQSTAGEGSVFWVELDAVDGPVVSLDRGDVTLSLPAIARSSRESTLLYVEDNPANMKLVQKIIERHSDIRLLMASDGLAGVELARSALPDVILLDINLPGINGFETLKMLREDPLTAHIPALAISANAMQSDIKKGQEAGFLRYLTKPIKVDEFLLALNAALEYSGRSKT
jgi:PAS domain S-box-containing protein